MMEATPTRRAALAAAWSAFLCLAPSSARPEAGENPAAGVADMADPERREDPLRRLMVREGQFHRPGIAYNAASGLTYDGSDLDPSTLLPSKPRIFSAASKESLQVAILAKALAGDPLARSFLSPEDPGRAAALALDLLERKAGSYERFDRDLPGFGGYLPWFTATDEGLEPHAGWERKVPALDNGQLAWSLMALVEALRAAGAQTLAERYQRRLDLMAANAGRMFHDAQAGKIRAEAGIPDPAAEPARSTYRGAGGHALEDAFEGELFVLFWSLYGGASDSEVRRVWSSKRLEPVEVATPRGALTVRRGWYFSAHEEWNSLLAPYGDVPLVRRVLSNNQRLRTNYSRDRGLPGLFASAHLPGAPLRYASGLGIPEAASQSDARTDVLVPYAAFPVILEDPAVGLAWYLAMLRRPGMSGPLGGSEAGALEGGPVAPVATWDAKLTVVLAALGGSGELARAYLRRTGKEEGFRALLAESYSRAFGDGLKGEDIPLALPPEDK